MCLLTLAKLLMAHSKKWLSHKLLFEKKKNLYLRPKKNDKPRLLHGVGGKRVVVFSYCSILIIPLVSNTVLWNVTIIKNGTNEWKGCGEPRMLELIVP